MGRKSLSIRKLLITAGMTFLVFWVSLFCAWQLLSGINFAYPVLYDMIGVNETITEYGPQNRFKKGFELTTREERIRLFSAIVDAINDDGKGLGEIRYHEHNGKEMDLLLREPEVVHLRDVATLLLALRHFSYMALFATAMLTAMFYWRRVRVMRVRYAFIAVGLLTIAGAFVSIAYGAKELFYKWHVLVFPDGHQWFFYYQDSLMSTMMKAPVMFGYIAVLIVVLALVLFSLFWWLLERFLSTRARRVDEQEGEMTSQK